jgi:3-deoxy-7-phosphoheptulonate synthase
MVRSAIDVHLHITYQSSQIDCSHGNSSKLHQNQIKVVDDIARQLEHPDTAQAIMGVMIESNLVEGQ